MSQKSKAKKSTGKLGKVTLLSNAAKKAAKRAAKKATKGKSTTSTQITRRPRCHYHDLTQMINFKRSGGTLYAGCLNAVERSIRHRTFAPELIIELSGLATDFKVEPVITGNERAHSDLPVALFDADFHARAPAVLFVDWSDGSAPDLPLQWWEDLAAHLRTVKGSVAVCCQGGHGRTGTALAILCALLKVTGLEAENPTDPIWYVRENYCDQAVETMAQVQYVERILGITCDLEGSNVTGWWSDAKDKGAAKTSRVVTSSAVTAALTGTRQDEYDPDFITTMEERHADPESYLIKGA